MYKLLIKFIAMAKGIVLCTKLLGDVKMVDMYLALVMNQRRTISQVPLTYRPAVTADLIALGLDGNGYPIAAAVTPVVTADDVNDVIVGINNTMEYAVDGGTYITYNATTPPSLTGTHTVNVRVSAVILVTLASLPTLLTFS